MTIDKSGKWWVGSDVADIRDYLVAYRAGGYEVHDTRICACVCGAKDFKLSADADEGCARRECTACGTVHLICDSAEYWQDAEPESWQCTECGCQTCNLGLGFSLREAEPGQPRDVRWISIGTRCANCGTLGSVADWKIDYGPSHHLVDHA